MSLVGRCSHLDTLAASIVELLLVLPLVASVQPTQSLAVCHHGVLLQAVGDDLIDSVSGDNIPIFAEEERYNQAVLSSVERLEAQLNGNPVPGEQHHKSMMHVYLQISAAAAPAPAARRSYSQELDQLALFTKNSICSSSSSSTIISWAVAFPVAPSRDSNSTTGVHMTPSPGCCLLLNPSNAVYRGCMLQLRDTC
jgi:hypothetical protein